ncbi:MAG: HlyD family efflux transporter periplasmic adaptor subunit [Acutalibacteraceae bacterium]
MNNPLIRKIGATAVAVLLLIYVGYQVYLSQYTGLKTEAATYSTVSESIDTTGFIIRDEEVISSSYSGVLNYTVDDGEKVAEGGAIAEIYPTEEDAAVQNRIARIDDELNRLSALETPSDSTASNPKLIGSQISKKLPRFWAR